MKELSFEKMESVEGGVLTVGEGVGAACGIGVILACTAALAPLSVAPLAYCATGLYAMFFVW